MKQRKEFDSIGNINVPDNNYWGASTQRSKKYFNIGKILVNISIIKSIAIIKRSAAIVHSKDKLISNKIARAIIKKPLLLLADEPVASLDPKAADLIMSLLKKINKDYNITVVCNLHQVDLAMKYSDRIVGLLEGQIMFDQIASNVEKKSINQIYK